MLILTRRVGETLMIGDEVSVTVLGVKGNQVRIGVNAPKEVAVPQQASMRNQRDCGGRGAIQAYQVVQKRQEARPHIVEAVAPRRTRIPFAGPPAGNRLIVDLP